MAADYAKTIMRNKINEMFETSAYSTYHIDTVVSIVVTPSVVYNVRYRMTIPPEEDAETIFNNKYLKKAMEKGIYYSLGVPVNYMNILKFEEKNTGLTTDI